MSLARVPSYDLAMIGAIVDDLRIAASRADLGITRAIYKESQFDDFKNAAWLVEIAFLKLLAALEALRLDSLKDMVLVDIREAKSTPNGFARTDDDGFEPYSYWMSRFRQLVQALETLGGPQLGRSITKDLVEILRATEYPMTDSDLFGGPPQSELDVHRRIEGVLRCVFPDLKSKPVLSKSIKNFEPDTGLPGIRTLIEYKFLASRSNAGRIADEILADTRGFVSTEWQSFVYVVYETGRFRPEHEWNALLHESEVSVNTTVIVLSGVRGGGKERLDAAGTRRAKRALPVNRRHQTGRP